MSWRAVVLTGVMALALAVMVPSVRAYLKQQETLQDLQGQLVDAQAQVDDLQGQVARWNDPAYVIAQARDRLVYVLPGETPYRVVDPEFVSGPGVSGDAASAVASSARATEPARPWFATLWGSIERAGAGA
jgi:cell division protein FtsB